jgi:hypothetical protein
MPPSVRVSHGNTVHRNKVQDWMMGKWNRLTNRWLDSILANPKHANATRTSCKWGLVVMGDCIEGHHDGNEGELFDPDFHAHMRCFERVYRDLAEEADVVYMVRGTRRHAMDTENELGEMLGAEVNTTLDAPEMDDDDMRAYCFDHLDLDIKGCLCSFKHKITGGGRPWTRGGNLARVLAAEQLHAVELKHRPPNVVIRAHAHHFDEYQSSQGMVVVCGPWKAIDPYGREATECKYAIPSLQVLDFRTMQADLPFLHWERVLPDPDPVMEH